MSKISKLHHQVFSNLLFIEFRRRYYAFLQKKGIGQFRLSQIPTTGAICFTGSSVLSTLLDEDWGQYQDIDVFLDSTNFVNTPNCLYDVFGDNVEIDQFTVNARQGVEYSQLRYVIYPNRGHHGTKVMDIVVLTRSDSDASSDVKLLVDGFDIEACKCFFTGTELHLACPEETFAKVSKWVDKAVLMGYAPEAFADRKRKYEKRGFLLYEQVT
jgi:hypothetical protein